MTKSRIPVFEDLFPIGTLAVIKKMARADQVIQIIVQGIERVTLTPDGHETAFLQADGRTDASAGRLGHAIRKPCTGRCWTCAPRILETINPQAQSALTR